VGLTPDAAVRLSVIRAGEDRAYGINDWLPQDVWLYTLGAVAFHKGSLEEAATYFRRVLDMGEHTRLRATWSAYMLGRVNAKQGKWRAARRAFTNVRQLSRRGAPTRSDWPLQAMASKPADIWTVLKRCQGE
jgi:hypothetical protein